MLLHMSERLMLLSILPKEGNFLTLKIVRKLREDLSLSEAEHKEYDFKALDDGRVAWSKEADAQPKEITIGEKATDIIVEALTALDKSNKLTDAHFTLYEKFLNIE